MSCSASLSCIDKGCLFYGDVTQRWSLFCRVFGELSKSLRKAHEREEDAVKSALLEDSSSQNTSDPFDDDLDMESQPRPSKMLCALQHYSVNVHRECIFDSNLNTMILPNNWDENDMRLVVD